MSILRLDERRRNVFGWADVDAAAQFAVSYAVEEINAKADREPYKEAYPCFDWQTQHQHEAKNYAENREQRDQGHTEWARTVGVFAPQNNHTEANEDKGEKRSDVREISKRSDVGKHGDATNEDARPNRRDIRRAEPRVNFRKILP